MIFFHQYPINIYITLPDFIKSQREIDPYNRNLIIVITFPQLSFLLTSLAKHPTWSMSCLNFNLHLSSFALNYKYISYFQTKLIRMSN